MAYVGHSPVREFNGYRAASAHGSAFAKSAVIAVAAAAAIMALSEGGGGATESASLAKGDRMAAPTMTASASSVGFTVDAPARTTTIERGAATPLSPDSPFRGR